MASALVSVLQLLQRNNYVSLAIATAVGYDYVLTFTSEVEYIWNQPWTWVSFLYILVRYIGLYFAIVAYLVGSTFIPGPVEVGRYALFILDEFAFIIFFGAANMVMILRVWAMHNRSMWILSILLVIFIPDLAISIILAISNISESMEVVVIHVLGFSFCETFLMSYTPSIFILQLIPAAVTCIFVVIQFARQSLQMRRAMKQWQLNRYMNLLVREGVIYFLAMLVFELVDFELQLTFRARVPAWFSGTLVVASYVPVFTLTPRFILGIRTLYVRDLRGRRGSGIDSGFGFSSLSDPGSVIVFAIGRNEASERNEEISMEGGNSIESA